MVAEMEADWVESFGIRFGVADGVAIGSTGRTGLIGFLLCEQADRKSEAKTMSKIFRILSL